MSSKKRLKLDTKTCKLSDVIETQELDLTESSERIRAFPVQSSNRFKCLSSKLVDQQQSQLNIKPQISNQECSQSRVEFYQVVSQLIKSGNAEKQGDAACTKELSKEDSLWQSELKEVIWLELQAWHAGKTVKEQDDYLVDARKQTGGILADIMNYRYQLHSDHMSTDSNDSGIDLTPEIQESNVNPMNPGIKCSITCHDYSCLSLFCPFCLERQNNALREIGDLLERLDVAESLFPSTKVLGEQYPLYNTPEFKAWVKAMQLWRNMIVWHRYKIVALGRRILLYINLKSQNWGRLSSSSSSSTPTELYDMELTWDDLLMFQIPIKSDFLDTKPLLKFGHFLNSIRTGQSRVYRQFMENLLKIQGLLKALHFLETIQLGCLHKGNKSLQNPTLEENLKNNDNQSNRTKTEDDELKRYGYWSPQTQTMGLPSYRGSYLFLARIPLDIVHEFLRMRLETKPKQPSNLSIIQLIRELKDGLSLAVVSRERYLSHIKAALWNVESNVFDDYKSSISEYDTSMQSILEVYLDYLQQWVQMIHQERVQKNILKEEWTFINTITPHIPGGQTLVGNSFCEMTTLMLRGIRKQFENSFSKYSVKIRLPSCTKLEKLEMCRELQSLCTETRLNAFITITLAKSLQKDLQKFGSIKENPNGKKVYETLCQLKFETLKMCECLVDIVISLDQMTDFLKDLEGRMREVVHQFFKFAFEFHREVCWIVTGHCYPQLCRFLISLAQHWMNFAKTRCERGRGLRPRWAHHGFDFLSTVCEPHITNILTNDEFEEFKKNIDECIAHVIGTSVPNSLAKSKSPTSYYSRSRELTSSGSTPFRRMSSLSDKDSMSPNSEPESPNYRNLSKRERLLEAIYKLDETFETKLKEQELIGKVVSVESDDSAKNYVRPRSVKFHWQRGIKIGQGRFGKVYTAVNNETGELMAMKEISLQPNDHRTIRSVALELKIFEGIHHENLVKYYGVEIHREEMLIFMELCTEGMLESLVAATEAGLPEALMRRYTYQLVTAVNTLHQHSIVHRDIKSANIFLTEGGNCLKLGDFGSAVKIRAHTTVPGELQGFVGTQAYMAPEVFMKINQEGHGRAVDVWSLGCVLVEMGSGKRPWADFDSNYQIMFKVGMGEIPAIPETLSEEGQNFATLCFVHNPKERATTIELLNHPFLVVDNEKEYTSFALPKILENFLKLGVKN